MTNPLLHKVEIPAEIEQAMNEDAVLTVSISGGKDSDAMLILLVDLCQQRGWAPPIAIHADMGRNEWHQTPAYVVKTAARAGVRLHVVTRTNGDLMSRWQERYRQDPTRPHWSDAKNRYCTSDHKRGPIDKLLRELAPTGTVICAMGIRAEESSGRAKKPVCDVRSQLVAKTLGRNALNWLPIHKFTEDEVWRVLGYSLDEVNDLRFGVANFELAQLGDPEDLIENDIHWPWHPAYLLGNDRLSCSLCVLATQSDLANGAKHNPEHYRQVVALENESGWSFQHKKWLCDLRPDLLTEGNKVCL